MFSKFDLKHIKRNHLETAAQQINSNGIPRKYLKNQYWVVVNGQEYPFKYLIRIANTLTPGNENNWIDLQSLPHFRDYVEQFLEFKINYYPNWANFFTQEEIELFGTIVNRKYRKDSNADRTKGLKILPLFHKTQVWAETLEIEDFAVTLDYKWQISGHFKPYTWARIFRKGDENNKIFFTIGVDAKHKSLVYKLDCLWSQVNKDALSEAQVIKFRKFLRGTNTDWISIPNHQLSDYNWDRLIIESKKFIESNIQLYDDVVEYVWGKSQPILHEENCLRPQSLNKEGYKKLPIRKATFRGINKDFLKESMRNKMFGDAGELLVIAYEREQLRKANKHDLAGMVKKIADGKGYDILSYYPNKNPKHIEVKTTTGSKIKPFPISWAEVEYMKQHQANYFLYRLYNYDPVTNSADFFILEKNIFEKLYFRELNFEAFIKSRE